MTWFGSKKSDVIDITSVTTEPPPTKKLIDYFKELNFEPSWVDKQSIQQQIQVLMRQGHVGCLIYVPHYTPKQIERLTAWLISEGLITNNYTHYIHADSIKRLAERIQIPENVQTIQYLIAMWDNQWKTKVYDNGTTYTNELPLIHLNSETQSK